jgi:EmrB/QacA subfamily drug resistance transporter
MTSFQFPEPAPLPALARKPSYPWFVVAGVSIGAFIGQGDASIVQLALPTLETAFDAPLHAVSWASVAYMLAFACALPPFARLADIAGRKTLYLAGFALFGVGSVLCGLAPTLGWLIVFRLLQGVAGALLGANSVAILVAAAGPARRGEALGIQAAAQAVGLSIGPAAGGLILGSLGWPWIFFLNVPFVLIGFVFAWLVAPKTRTFAGDRRFDWAGVILLVPALAALLLAIAEGRAWGLGPALITCLVAGPVLLAAFIWREMRAPAPLIDLRLFRAPAFAAGGLGVLVSYAMLYGIFFAMAFALVRGYRDDAIVAGLRLAIVPVVLGLVAPFAGAASNRWPRPIMLSGMALCAIAALALLATLTGMPGSLPAVMAALAVYGAGLGLYIAPNNGATMGAAPADKSGVAGGVLNLLRMFGSALGVAASATALSWRLESLVGKEIRTSAAPPDMLLSAVGAVLVLMIALAVLGAAAALVRGSRAQTT